MFKHFIILILTVSFFSGTAQAANVYLKDGGVIKCFFARQQGETVYVLVNRYTEIVLDRRTVALQRTFKNRKSIGSYRQADNSALE